MHYKNRARCVPDQIRTYAAEDHFIQETAAAFCASMPMRLGLIAAALVGVGAGVLSRRAFREDAA